MMGQVSDLEMLAFVGATSVDAAVIFRVRCSSE